MGWGTFWGWRGAVHSKKTARNTKIIAAEITRPRREAEAAAKAERKAGRKRARAERRDMYPSNGCMTQAGKDADAAAWWAEQRRNRDNA
jgi:hypothetical protein